MPDTPAPGQGGSDEPTDDKGGSDEQPKEDKTKDFVSKAEFDDAVKRRQKALERAKSAEDRLSEMEARLKSFEDQAKELDTLKRKAEDDEAAKKGDIEKIRKSAADREAELAGKIGSLESELKKIRDESAAEVTRLKETYLLKAEVMRTLSEVTVDPELVWLLLGGKFELVEEDGGGIRTQVKDSTLDVKAYVEKTLEETNRANLLKSTRKAGTGTEAPPGDGKGGTKMLTPEQIAKLPDKGKQYFRENPEAARQYAANRTLGK